MRLVLDTNVVLSFLGGQLAEDLPAGEPTVSIITEMELLCYADLDAAGEEVIRAFLRDVLIEPLSNAVKDRAIAVRKAHKVKLPDAIIAATALELDAALLTNDMLLPALLPFANNRSGSSDFRADTR